ncbi:MAG TPA: DUF1512 domain-containing protein [Nitrososphaeraceae archaeon]|jgi:hypothetical protein|nr:DUF1512 domain-containing protein [Nitrososphaeraceae archaeon]
MVAYFLQQLGGIFGPGGGSDSGSNPFMYILWFAPIFILMIYGQKLQSWMILGDISKSLSKLKTMKEMSRKEAIDYVKTLVKPSIDPSERIDKFIEYFAIMPVDLDPNGIIGKLDHIMRTKDERIRSEIKTMADEISNTDISNTENILEAASALNMIYKAVRHFYLMGKRTTNMFVLVQLQMVMPLLLQEAEALQNGISAFKNGQPIGDGIGPMVVGKMMIGKEKKLVAKETLYTEDEYRGRKLYLLKAEGPSGVVGRPGEGVQRLAGEMGFKIDIIIMVDAALKLEGEQTGTIAEGIGAAIGGIGVERYQIEDVATRFNIPVYAIIVKESIQDAISVMRKEISDSFDKVTTAVLNLIEDKTLVGQSVLVIGVGNTLGVAQ